MAKGRGRSVVMKKRREPERKRESESVCVYEREWMRLWV